MSLQLLIRCDSPGCTNYKVTPTGQPPSDWLTINGQATLCTWTCLAIYAAQVAGTIERAVQEPAENGQAADVTAPDEAEVGTASST